MADNLVKVQLKNGQVKEISSRIAYDKNYQASMGFKLLDGSISAEVEPQKKIEKPNEGRKPAAVTNELGSGVETVDLTDTIETVEEKVARLHRENKTEQEIKEATGINMNTIRSIIKKLK